MLFVMINRFFTRVGTEHFAFGLILPIGIIWKVQNGLSLAEVAFTESLILIATVLMEIPAGYFADKFSNRTSLGVGSLLHLVALSVTLLAPGILGFSVAALAFGAGWAFISGADEAHIHDDYTDGKDSFQNWVSKAHIIDEVGTILGMITGSLIALSQSSELQYVIGAAAVIMAAVTLFSFFALPARSHKSSGLGDEQTTLFKLFFKNLKKFWFIFAVLAIVYEYGRFLWQPRLTDVGIDIAGLGIVFAALKVASVIGTYVASKSDFGKREIGFFFGLTILSLATLTTTHPAIIITGLAVLLFSENFLRVWQSVVLNRLSGTQRASFLSSASLSRNVIGAFLIFALGFPAERSITFAVVVLILVKVSVGALLIAKHAFKHSYPAN